MEVKYKDSSNKVHQIEEGSEHFMVGWPTGYAKITDAEANAILNPPKTLDALKLDKIAELEIAYSNAIQLPVSYMATTFQADEGSQTTLTKCLVAGSVPAGFFWLDSTNVQIAMTFVELQGLAGAMLAQGQLAFVNLQFKKDAVRNATTISNVNKVAW